MNSKKIKNPYQDKYIALLRKPINVSTDFCSIIQEFSELNTLRCGLFSYNIVKDDIYNTLYVTLTPTKHNKYHFLDITYEIYEYDKKPTTSIILLNPNKGFDEQEIFKANGFVDFINDCLLIKETVESDPNKFYFKYNKLKFIFKDNKWYKNNEEIHEFDLLEFFFKIPWEYDSDKIKIKKYNIFKHLINYGRK